jgi:hypothetical protein
VLEVVGIGHLKQVGRGQGQVADSGPSLVVEVAFQDGDLWIGVGGAVDDGVDAVGAFGDLGEGVRQRREGFVDRPGLMESTHHGSFVEANDDSAAGRLTRLADGYLVTQLLVVAVELRLAEHLVAGPRTAADLAAQVGAVPGAVARVLRGLAAEEVVQELPDGRFAGTPLTALLAENAPGSLAGAVRARGELYYRPAAQLTEATRKGGVPFEYTYGVPFFEHLADQPQRSAVFQASMASRAAREAAAVVAAYDFRRFRTLVDVGGGPGVLLAEVLRSAPQLSGLIVDRPEVVATATLPAVAGDFFRALPAGRDAYLLSRVLHDWDDEDAVRILTTCRRAMVADGVLLIVEAVLPDLAVDDPAAIRMDLHMLLLFRGRERTVGQFAALLAAAGLRLTQVTATPAGVTVIEARPATDCPPRPSR